MKKVREFTVEVTGISGGRAEVVVKGYYGEGKDQEIDVIAKVKMTIYDVIHVKVKK